MQSELSSSSIRSYLQKLLQQLCVEIGVHDAGSEGDRLAVEIVRRELAEVCDSVEIQSFAFERWIKESPAELRIGEDVVECWPFYGSVGTSSSGVEGRIRRPARPDGLPEDFDGWLLEDARGRTTAILAAGPFGRAVPRYDPGLISKGVPVVGIDGCSIDSPNRGDATSKSVRLRFSARNYPGAETSNVIGTLEGQSDRETLIIAHRDTQYSTPGANDNTASLVTMLLLARHFRLAPPRSRITFLASGAEEIGCLGAQAFTHLRQNESTIDRINLCINFDSLTYGKHPQIYTVQTTLAETLAACFRSRDPESNPRIFQKNDTLDGAPFAERGIPTIYLNSRGNDDAKLKLWHRPEDLPDTVDPEFVALYFRSVAAFLEEKL